VTHRQRKTAIDAAPVGKHRTGAALTVIAALLCSGLSQLLAQEIEKRRSWIHIQLERTAIDSQFERFPQGFGRLGPAFRNANNGSPP